MSRTAETSQQIRMLLGHLSQNSRAYLELSERLETLPSESEEVSDVLGELYAHVQQVHMDAEDVIEAMDAYTDSLSDDDE